MKLRSFLHHLNRRDTRLIPKFSPFVKITLIALIAVSSIFFAHKLFAETQQSVYQYKSDAIDAGGNQEAWLSEAFGSNAVIGVNALTGKIQFNPDGTVKIGWKPGGALGSTTNMIASLYQPPASGIEYLAQVKDNFLGKPAYAQGVGFAGLQPILNIWRGFRNMIYILSSLIFIIIGIMIMLRVKISPQAVVTIQNAIPQLITTLILVTFSYAIAGLLIDLAGFIQAVVLVLLFQIQGRPLTSNIVGVDMSPIPLVGADFSFARLSQANLSSIYFLTRYMLPMNAIALIGAVLGAIVGGVFAGPSLGTSILIGGGIGTVIILLIVMIAVLIWQIKFFFGLIKCYVTLIFKIVIAPLEIGLGAFPNAKMGFSSWITDVIANLAVFPISLIFLVMANIIIDQVGVAPWRANPVVQGGIWTPNLLNGGGLPGVAASVSGGLVPAAFGLAAALILSKLPDMIPQFIFMLKPSPWTQAANIDLSRNALVKTGLGVGKNFIANEIENPVNANRRFPRLGGYIDRLAGRINSPDTKGVKDALGEGIRKS